MKYEYITENNLENRQKYQYTQYRGGEFLQEYEESRNVIVDAEVDSVIPEPEDVHSDCREICHDNADGILKSFEVRKRIYKSYGDKMKPLDEDDYNNEQLYLDFSLLMSAEYKKTGNLKYLNALLKANDTILSIRKRMTPVQMKLLENVLAFEQACVKKLMGRNVVHKATAQEPAMEDESGSGQPVCLSDVAMVCGNTSRSKAYLQVLQKAGLRLNKCYIMTEHADELQAEAEAYQPSKSESKYFCKAEPLLYTLHQAQIPYEFIHSEDINSTVTLQCLRNAEETYLIYSGFGGQILKAPLFQMRKYFIHTHAGWVPDFRGSTTIYYHMLDSGDTAASVMFLNEQLDEGDILGRKYFAVTDKQVDLDTVFEPYTRAVTLAGVLKEYASTGRFRHEIQPKEGNTFYIIHPVLKHIAIVHLKNS